ncbi:glycine decarboxylase subunit H [Pichia kluyveri]|uniref:Glycine cleavage system H protein n=1 Tax=Pichia kluyveri TaxID=36015 RepID=A0AAV5R093_PICKL|nr:glycine decarboxylase subunit H [Pichia kluyveri]
MFALTRNIRFTKQNFSSFKRLQSTFKLNPNSIVSTYSKSPIVKFTNEHEWISIHPDGTGFIGITNYAADALGDATFIELPTHQIGEDVKIGDTISSIESVKSASDIYSPVECKIIDVNQKLDDNPELLNVDPMGDGWIVKVEVTNNDSSELLDADKYEEFVKEE